ncbi:MAG: hypothetical protein J6N18_02070 [Kiritimatiellae bacterium]|nr:hypothetical protein [Kiritimatiellia bacterium]
MKRGYTFRTPTAEDIEFVAANMREADRRELKRWTGLDSEWGLENSVAQSEVCFSGVFGDGKVACIFGATRINLMESDAVLWALSTTEVDRHRIEFAAATPAGLDLIFRAMPDTAEFGNWVDLDYNGAVRWIERNGGDFSLTTPRRPGRCGGVFGYFYMVNPYFKREDD